MSGFGTRNTTGLEKDQLLRGLSGEAAKVAVRMSFEEILQMVAQSIQAVLPTRFRFVLIMVSPDQDVKMLHNCGDPREANGIVRHVSEGAKPTLKIV